MCLSLTIEPLPKNVHTEMLKVLKTYDETELAKAFVVVEKNRHRIRRIE